MHKCQAPGCSYSAKLPSLLRQHERQHSGERPYRCTQGCEASYTTRTAQLKHERVHAGPHHVCPTQGCGFIAANSGAMVRHSRAQGHASSVECPHSNCTLRFSSYKALWMHRKGPAHAGEGGAPLCKACGASFATVAEYTAHTAEHAVARLASATMKRKKTAPGLAVSL